MSDRAPSPLLLAARLFEKTSAKGRRYFQGRMGPLKVLILENLAHDPTNSEQSHTHSLMIGEAAPYQPRDQAQPGAATAAPVVPFPPRPAPAPPPPVPPWEDLPAARAPHQPRQSKPDGRKRVAGGGKVRLEEDTVPFSPEVR